MSEWPPPADEAPASSQPPPLPPPPLPPPLPAWGWAGYALPPALPRVWPVFVGYLILFIGMFLIATAAFAVWFVVRGEVGMGAQPIQVDASVQQAFESPVFVFTLLSMIALLGGTVAVCGAMLSPRPIVKRLALGPSWARLAVYIATVLGTLAISQMTMTLVALLELRPGEALQGLDKTLLNLRGWQIVAGIAVIGLAAGVCEELFFRGYMQTRLVERWGITPALFITAALFGLLHLDLIQSPFTFVLGLFIGWVSWRAGSIRPAIAAHVINNSLVVLLLAAVGDGAPAEEVDAEVQPILAGYLGFCAVVFVACVWLIHRKLPPGARQEAPVQLPPPPPPLFPPPPPPPLA